MRSTGHSWSEHIQSTAYCYGILRSITAYITSSSLPRLRAGLILKPVLMPLHSDTRAARPQSVRVSHSLLRAPYGVRFDCIFGCKCSFIWFVQTVQTLMSPLTEYGVTAAKLQCSFSWHFRRDVAALNRHRADSRTGSDPLVSKAFHGNIPIFEIPL